MKTHDAHCHFFNHDILSLRLLVELLISIRKGRKAGRDMSIFAKSKIGKALQFVKIGFSSTEKIFKTLEKDEKGFVFCPLMFDVDWSVRSLSAFSKSEQDVAVYEVVGDIEKELYAELKTLVEEEQLGDEGQELLEFFEPSPDRIKIGFKDTFNLQEEYLLDLKKSHPDRIFPFFAVDPRRKELFQPGEGEETVAKIIERLNPQTGFSGIKLYTPNGYSPADERLLPLYAYCEQHQIPITAHCSGAGFATFAPSIDVKGPVYLNGKVVFDQSRIKFQHNKLTDSKRVEERAQTLNHPALWHEVLKMFPNLKLNLAHFGLKGDSDEWTNYIFDMMQTYPNLHTDLSCVCDQSSLEHIYKNYYQKASDSVKSRFLYGSDFYLNMLFVDSMKVYVKQFMECFTAEEWEAISQKNAEGFLGSM